MLDLEAIRKDVKAFTTLGDQGHWGARDRLFEHVLSLLNAIEAAVKVVEAARSQAILLGHIDGCKSRGRDLSHCDCPLVDIVNAIAAYDEATKC